MPTFGVPQNNVSTTVGSTGYVAGSGFLTLVPGGGSAFPSLAGGQYLRATVIQAAFARLPSASASTYTIFKVTAVAGDVLTISGTLEGTLDRGYMAGDVVEMRITAGMMNDLQVGFNSPFGASGPGHTPGAVPDPGAVAGTIKYVREDATFQDPLVIADGHNVVLGTVTGTRVGTATTNKLGFYGATPIIQPSGDALAALSNLGLVSAPTLANLFDFLSPLVNTPISITTTATLTSGTMNVCSGTSAFNVGLPPPVAGKIVGIRMAPFGSSAGQLNKLINVLPAGSEKIDGAASRVMWAGEFAVLYSDGVNWFKLCGRTIPMLCQLNNSTGQSIPSGAWTTVLCDSTLQDNTGTMADTLNDRIVIRRPAIYSVSGTAGWQAFPAPSGNTQMILQRNGANMSQVVLNPIPTAGLPTMNTNTVVSLVSGDLITEQLYQSSGGPNTLFLGLAQIMVSEISSW